MNDGTVKIGTELDPTGMKKGLDGLGGYSKQGYGAIGLAAKGMAIVTTAALSAVAAGMSAAVVAGLNYNRQMENEMASFTTMLGDEAAALAKVEELKKLAAETPYEMTDLAKSTTTLLAFGIANERTTENIAMLGDISLGSVDKLDRLTLAFGKASSQGKLTGENVQMMIEAGFNPLKVIAETTGESMEELTNRMSKGGISAEEMTAAFKKATDVGGQFYKGMETASKTTDGLISTLQDNANALLGQVMEPISKQIKERLVPSAIKAVEKLTNAFERDGIPGMIKAIKQIAPALGPVLDLFKWAMNNVGTVANVLGTVTAAVVAYNAVLAAQIVLQEVGNALTVISALASGGEAAAKLALASATGSATVAQWLLNTAMAANPVGLLVAGIAALVAGLVLFQKDVDRASEETKKLVEDSKTLVQASNDAKDAFEDQITSIDANAIVVKQLADELYSLSEKEMKTNEEKSRMVSLVAMLNKEMPELNLTINAQTGAINKNKKQVDALIKSKLEEIRLQAYQEEILRLYKEQNELAIKAQQAQDKKTQSTEAMTRAQEEYDRSIENGADHYALIHEIEMYEDSAVAAETALKQLSEAQAANSENVATYEAAYKSASSSVVESNDAIVKSTKEVAPAVKESLERQKTEKEEYEKAMLDATQRYYDMLGDIHDKGIEQDELTVEEWAENRRQQVEDMEEWRLGMVNLAGRVPEEFLAYLAELGPGQTKLINGLVESTPEELAKYLQVWEDGFGEAEKVSNSLSSKVVAAYGDPYSTFYGMSEQSINGLVDGLKNGGPQAEIAAREIARGTAAAYKKAQQQHSPSKVWRQMGQMDVAGIPLGYRDMEPTLKASSMKTAALTTGTMVSQMQSQAIKRSVPSETTALRSASVAPQSKEDYGNKGPENIVIPVYIGDQMIEEIVSVASENYAIKKNG